MKPPCIVAGCDRESRGLGLCNAHYKQYQIHGKITHLKIKDVGPKRTTPIPQCSVEGCKGKMIYTGLGLCKYHYNVHMINKPGRKRCRAEGCTRPYIAHGLCETHYRRLIKYGTISSPGEMRE